jgi:peptide-methionine (S)-S-oxide reductase
LKILTILFSLLLFSCDAQKTENKQIPNKQMVNYKTITFGGGCFWCIESCFNKLKGVEVAISGYSGGTKENPTYEEVCSGETHHAEVVQLKYNPKEISYEQLLEVFFFLHNPTQVNRQGNDVGTQYRSIIFYNDDTEKKIAEEKIAAINQSKKYADPVVTELKPFQKFWPAETYHQGYFTANPNQPYCSAVVGPKIKKFSEHFQAKGWLKK